MGKVDDDTAELLALAEVRKHALNGCCGNDEWRGRYCQYHLGMADGVEIVMMVLRGDVAVGGNDA